MARYQLARNGQAYGKPLSLWSVNRAIASRAKHDGGAFRWIDPQGAISPVYKWRHWFLYQARKGLRHSKPGDLQRFTTRVGGETPALRYHVRTSLESIYPTTPAATSMPPAPKGFLFGTGVVFCGGSCKDDYANMEEATILGQYVKLQAPAMDSFVAASQAVGGIKLTGSWRSCADQSKYYASDHARYAPPNETAHTRGLAIDVSQNQDAAKLAAIHEALSSRGWFQARTDEPWHYSYAVRV